MRNSNILFFLVQNLVLYLTFLTDSTDDEEVGFDGQDLSIIPSVKINERVKN